MPLLSVFNKDFSGEDNGTELFVGIGRAVNGADIISVSVQSKSLIDVALIGSRVRSAYPQALELINSPEKGQYSLGFAWNCGVGAGTVFDALNTNHVLEPEEVTLLKEQVKNYRHP